MGKKGRCIVRREKRKSAISWIVAIICVIVFCGTAVNVFKYAKNTMEAEKQFSAINLSDDSGSVSLEDAYKKNNDLVGWIKAEGTRIDYPVMQTKDDPEFYLHRNFNKEPSDSGTPFMDAACDLYDGPPSWDWIIYGHHMRIGTMFHDLVKYQDKDFWEKHRNFTFDVYDPATKKTESGIYEVFAVCLTNIKPEESDEFKYYEYGSCKTKEMFDEYVAGVKAEALYDTEITPKFGDQLITLSSCAYHTDSGRIYIVGHRIK